MRRAHLKRLGWAVALAAALGGLPGIAAAEPGHGHGGAYVRVDGGRHHGHHRYYGHARPRHWSHHGYRHHYRHDGWGHHYRPRHYRHHYRHHYRPYYGHHVHGPHCGHAGYGGDHAAALGVLLGYTLLYGDE